MLYKLYIDVMRASALGYVVVLPPNNTTAEVGPERYELNHMKSEHNSMTKWSDVSAMPNPPD